MTKALRAVAVVMVMLALAFMAGAATEHSRMTQDGNAVAVSYVNVTDPDGFRACLRDGGQTETGSEPIGAQSVCVTYLYRAN